MALSPEQNQPKVRQRRTLAHVPYLLPAFIFIAALTFIPAAYTIYLSFTNASLIYPSSSFVGLANYARLFTDSATIMVLKNTFVFVGWSVVLQITLGLGLALLLDLPFRGRNLVRILMLATWVIPEIVVGFTWQVVLAGGPHGLANSFLVPLGLEPILFFSNGNLAMAALIFVNVWRGTAFTMILFLAALQGIPNELYEAGRIDGASPPQLLRFVTLPMIAATVLITFVNNTLQTFNVTALIFSLTGGGPARSTEILAFTMYRAAFETFDLGFASAIAMLLFIINVVLIFVYLVVFRRTDTQDTL